MLTLATFASVSVGVGIGLLIGIAGGYYLAKKFGSNPNAL